MKESNYKALVDKYRDYLESTEALAVYLVKAYVKQININKKWVDVVSSSTWSHKSKKTAFNYLIVEIFDRKTYPFYPNKSDNLSEHEYRQICRAITWEVSHNDIDAQRLKGDRGQLYLTIIPVLNKNHGKTLITEKPFWNEEYGGFDYTGKVPTTSKKVEVRMKPEWDYFVKACKKITDIDAVRIEKNFDSYILPRIHEERKNLMEWYFEEYKTN